MSASVAAAIVAAQAATPALIQAHRAAAAFHDAMADALEAQTEIDEAERHARAEKNPVWALDYREEVAELQPRYAAALGKAAVAMQKMPVRWAEVLGVAL